MLIIMRHGKSDWNTRTTDHDRPLTKRGVRSARAMGTILTDLGLAPDLIISSTANRARSTAQEAAETAGWGCELRTTDDFYDTGVDTVISVLKALDDSTQRCLIVGHNPTWTDLVAELTGARVAMRTATVAAIDTPGRWDWLDGAPCELVTLLQPRHFLS